MRGFWGFLLLVCASTLAGRAWGQVDVLSALREVDTRAAIGATADDPAASDDMTPIGLVSDSQSAQVAFPGGNDTARADASYVTETDGSGGGLTLTGTLAAEGEIDLGPDGLDTGDRFQVFASSRVDVVFELLADARVTLVGSRGPDTGSQPLSLVEILGATSAVVFRSNNAPQPIPATPFNFDAVLPAGIYTFTAWASVNHSSDETARVSYELTVVPEPVSGVLLAAAGVPWLTRPVRRRR